LSCLCVLYTAVCCQPLILCCMRDFVTIIFILYRCVMSIFDCILCLWVYHKHIYILYSCVLSTFDCMLYVCCCIFWKNSNLSSLLALMVFNISAKVLLLPIFLFLDSFFLHKQNNGKLLSDPHQSKHNCTKPTLIR
jgi:hypothetical protein